MSLIEFEFTFPDLQKKLKTYEKEIRLFVAAQMQTNRGMLFDAEGAYNGHEKWAPLKFRDGMILSHRGNLRKSLAPQAADGTPGPDGIVRFEGDFVIIGTNLYYARMMNDGTTKLPGGVLKATHAKALKIPLPAGKKLKEEVRQQVKEKKLKTTTIEKQKYIFRKSVRIPERPFDNWTAADETELAEALMNKIVEVLAFKP